MIQADPVVVKSRSARPAGSIRRANQRCTLRLPPGRIRSNPPRRAALREARFRGTQRCDSVLAGASLALLALSIFFETYEPAVTSPILPGLAQAPAVEPCLPHGIRG